MNNQIEIETFANIVGFPNYQVSTFGNVKNITTGRILKHGNGTGGYLMVRLSNDGDVLTKRIHKLVADAFLENPDDKKCVDHIDHNRLNNHLSNLRYATHSENQHNRTKNKDNTSGVAGVSWHKNIKKWEAKITINGVKKHLGSFENKDDAITARTNAEIQYFREFRAINQVV